MRFRVSNDSDAIFFRKNMVRLEFDKWDDNHYQTSFNIYYNDALGREFLLGPVKIGYRGMEKGCILDKLPIDFIQLSDKFFSVGQDELYYTNIAELGDSVREEILRSLQDVAFNLNHFEVCHTESVMEKSLLRSISSFTVRGQFNRIAKGGVKLTEYNFLYCIPRTDGHNLASSCSMDFHVHPNSNPPSNVHVIIGRNGSGKTRLLQSMINSLITGDSRWKYKNDLSGQEEQGVQVFANIVCIAFSPFDDFLIDDSATSAIPCKYIGLNKHSRDLLQAINEQFFSSFSNCMLISWKRRLWLESVEFLKSDPILANDEIFSITDGMDAIESDAAISERKVSILNTFSRLSSGHKLVLLIITTCVDRIEEKSIVFFDEPENHLHPPLVSALIRALSNLLSDRNGVAIMTTHSPVVLQEVPSSCVWVLNRYGTIMKAERPSIQTFGENIGSLTREVFGLEVTKTGFHDLLYEMVKKSVEDSPKRNNCDDYEYIASQLDNQLGNEASTLLKILIGLEKKEVL